MKPLNLQLLLDVLLDCNSELPLRKKVLDEFVEYCALITDIDADVTFNAFAPDTHLPSGMAINPQAAAMCVTDYGRTTAFIRAVHDAMEYLLAQTRSNALTTSQTLNVLYAGCGPYATLMLATIVKFQEHSINFHMLDIHQSSLDSVQILLRHFGVDVQKIQFFCADACEFKPKIKFDLIVAETMQKALEQEPQFQLTVNLKQYLTEKGVFIPEAIQLQLALIHWKQELEITLKYKQKLLQTDIKQFDRVLIGGD
ncbi:hypothetical protein [Marinicellulosiphila megalodicopiae]|uniref:hypothetical protein n=1 Tax=Marinicellulosiphila megalodicopiae TaxID=2724896 RepID=UPI003BAE781F